MGRRRSFDPAMWQDKKFRELKKPVNKLCFIGGISNADDEAIGSSDPEDLRILIFANQTRLKLILEARAKIIELQLAVDYEYNRQKYWFFPNYHKHQKIEHPTETKNPRPPIELVAQYPQYIEGLKRTFTQKGQFIGSNTLRQFLEDSSKTHEDSSKKIREDSLLSKVKLSKVKLSKVKDHSSTEKSIEQSPSENINQIIEEIKTSYEQIFDRKLKVWDSVRKNILKRRLEKWTLAELIQIQKNIRASPFHMGENPDHKKYCDFELLYRSDRQVEKYLNLLEALKTKKSMEEWLKNGKK